MEKVFNLMDLFLAQAYFIAFQEEEEATLKLRVHKENFGEWVAPMTTFGENVRNYWCKKY